MIHFKQLFATALALLAAASIWIPSLHLFFRPGSPASKSASANLPDARALAKQQIRFWHDPALKVREIERMRLSNAEWDFMGRTFLVLALCEMCERDASLRPECLPVVDTIIDETLALEKEHDMHFFLMPYSRMRPYRVEPARSLFVDGEIALMLATRRIVEEKPPYKTLFEERARLIGERLRNNPAMAAESYPDECWLFDHAIALAALRLSDYLDATNHTQLFRDWGDVARKRLTHAESGLLISQYTADSRWMDGPEGSSIWAAVHFLRIFDPELAKNQYRLARRQLARTLLGFGWSREWPLTWRNQLDIDSGAVIPIVDAGAAASGLALIASSSFRDAEFHDGLRTSLNFAAFPVRKNGQLRFCASNAVGDAALLYALTLGPIWEKVTTASAARP